MITNIIFARKTWCPEYTNNIGLEVDRDKYKYLNLWSNKKEIEGGYKISPNALLYGSDEIKLTIEHFSF